MSEAANPTLQGNKPFLSHIEGLRGLAIILIVLYHLNPEWCVRGYFGVDVFLVISGYLIYKGYQVKKESLNFLSFCKARFSRIFPPVLAMLVAYHLLSAFLLDSREWEYYSHGGVAALLGYANVYFDNLMKDYFAADAARYPLLHLWYLSVIIHFYVLFAVIFLVLKKVPVTWRWGFLLLLALVSFYIFKFWQIPFRFMYKLLDDPLSQPPVSAYYWTIGRFWECIVGMLIVYMPRLQNNTAKSALTLLGVLGIILPSFLPFRGPQQNLFAICGTMLVIAYVPTGFASRVLSNGILQFIGKISFSLYLWHYVVFNLWKHYTYWGLTTWDQHLYMLGASIILSWGAWHLVEKRKLSFRACAICWAVVLGLSYFVSQSGMASKLRSDLQYHISMNANDFSVASLKGTPYEYLNTDATFRTWSGGSFAKENRLAYIGDTNKAPTFLMMGDSHAHAYLPGIDQIGKQKGFAGVFAVSRPLPLCKADFSIDKPAHHQTMTEQVMMYLARHPELTTVLATCRWGDEFTHYDNNPELAVRRFCEEIRKLGKKLVLITDNPTLQESRIHWYGTFCRINGLTPRKEAVECSEEAYYQYNGRAIAALEQLEREGLCNLVRVEPYLFRNGVFNAFGPEDTLLMYDKDHLSDAGAIYFSIKMQEQLHKHLR